MKNDYEFGNHLFELRKAKGLSQSDIATSLNISDRAISKWENGISKPTLNNLKELSNILDIPLDDLLNYNKKKKEQKITKVILTGGPCSGKTKCMDEIKKHFEAIGYKVICVPSVGALYISTGIFPFDYIEHEKYEELILKSKIELDKHIDEAVSNLDDEKILIVYERGPLDTKSYCSNKEFKKICANTGINELELKNYGDVVFHLKTTAKGHKEFYERNSIRKETIEEAIILDDKLINAWSGRRELRIIDSFTHFDDKVKKVIKEISTYLKEEKNKYIKKTYLIKMPNIEQISKLKGYSKVTLNQIFLQESNEDKIVSIVIRKENNNSLYYKVEKTSKGKYSTSLKANEYIDLLEQKDHSRKKIIKDRHNFVYKSKMYKLDIFPFWKDKAVLEVDLLSEREEVILPPFIEVIEEIKDNSYESYTLSKRDQ